MLLPPAHEHVVRYLLALGRRRRRAADRRPDELGVVVDAARKGGRHVAPSLHHALSGAVALPALDDRTADLLTAREREVLVLLAEGRTNREIAAALSVTLATVKSHLVRIYAKLEAEQPQRGARPSRRARSAGVARSPTAPRGPEYRHLPRYVTVGTCRFLHLVAGFRPMRHR